MIADLLQTQTFRDWFNKTNEIIDALNSSYLGDGVTANGVYTIANPGSFLVVNTFFANSSLVSIRGNTTMSANVVVSSNCNSWNFAAGSLILQPINGTSVNSPASFTAAAPVTFLGTITANANVAITADINQTGNTLLNGTFTSNGGPAIVRQVLFASANSICAPAALTNPEYDDYNPSGLTECECLNLTPNVDVVLTGLAAPTNFATGTRVLYLQNMATGFNVSLASSNTSSAANNQFKLPGDSTFVLTPGTAVVLLWSSTNHTWRAAIPPPATVSSVFASLTVTGSETVGNTLSVSNTLSVTGNTTIGGFINANSTLQVAGNTTIGGFANIASTLRVAGNTTLLGTLAVTGNGTFSSNVAVNAGLTVTGLTSLQGDTLITTLRSVAYPTVNKTANYTITANDDFITCNGTFTVSLPPAASLGGHKCTIKNTNTGVITLSANGTEKIDGSGTYALTGQYQSATVESDGSTWWVA